VGGNSRGGRSGGEDSLARLLGDQARKRLGPAAALEEALLVEAEAEAGEAFAQLAREQEKCWIYGAMGQFLLIAREGFVDQQAARCEERSEGRREGSPEVTEDQHGSRPAGRQGERASRPLEVRRNGVNGEPPLARAGGQLAEGCAAPVEGDAA
jgi:hypothetical protein